MKKLSIHALLHVPFEGLGCIENWINDNGHSLSFTQFYSSYQLPSADTIDWLIVMGGPMGIYDDNLYPWLSAEKEFIAEVISKNKTVIGICLGSQLIANVLGARVYTNKQKEIGWFDINKSHISKDLPIISDFETQFRVFHWHGDTFDLPTSSTLLFSSAVCINQAFLYNDKVLGLQFHFEVTKDSLLQMIENGQSELIENDTIQTAETIVAQSIYIASNNKKMVEILNYLSR